ncbi:MAG: imidazole glycerol phosphate synthase subunit HisH [Anaerovorax sp.]
MIGIIDYGAGNLFSVKNAMDFLGAESKIICNPEELKQADKLILPGVGALPDAMKKLENTGLIEVILQETGKGKPLLGICLGMQMLFERGFEFGETTCLGLIPGTVSAMEGPEMALLKIPHMGWNDVKIANECALSKGIKEGQRFYYVHSYKAVTEPKYLSLYSEYGGIVPGLVFKDHIYGTQFHPEKSGAIGLQLLKNYIEV